MSWKGRYKKLYGVQSLIDIFVLDDIKGKTYHASFNEFDVTVMVWDDGRGVTMTINNSAPLDILPRWVFKGNGVRGFRPNQQLENIGNKPPIFLALSNYDIFTYNQQCIITREPPIFQQFVTLPFAYNEKLSIYVPLDLPFIAKDNMPFTTLDIFDLLIVPLIKENPNVLLAALEGKEFEYTTMYTVLSNHQAYDRLLQFLYPLAIYLGEPIETTVDVSEEIVV